MVRLDETPTSGYRWEVQGFEASVLQPAGDASVRAGSDRIGGAGHREFRFDVVGPGRCGLRLICRRSWEPESAAVDELHATIVATD